MKNLFDNTHLLAAVVATIGAGSAVAQDYQARMGEPLRGLTDAELALFENGKVAFNQLLTTEDGLGPGFNDNSCGACHSSPATGGFSTKLVTHFGHVFADGTFDPLAELGGDVLQAQSVDESCQEVLPAEANHTAVHSTPHVFGSGLVDRIPDAVLLAMQNNPPQGVTGVAQIAVPLEGGPPTIGRFGWKSQIPTVMTFTAEASRDELGLTNRFVPEEHMPGGDPDLLAQCDAKPVEPWGYDDVIDPATGLEKIDLFAAFQTFLAPPPQTPKNGMAGEGLFESIGCTKCHRPSFTTPTNNVELAFSNVTFRPYSDFLVHDMGSLGDGLPMGAATDVEFRTAPLWGLSHREAFLHDTRASGGTFAENVTMAISEHNGEATHVRDTFLALPAEDREAVIAFLGSLGRAEFDVENDNDVDQQDWFFAEPGFTGPGVFFGPEDPGAVSDVDQDGDFDMVDFTVMMRAWTGEN